MAKNNTKKGNTKPVKGTKSPATPSRVTPSPVLKQVHHLAHAPNSPGGSVTELHSLISGNNHPSLKGVKEILYSGHTDSEKMELLRGFLKGKI